MCFAAWVLRIGLLWHAIVRFSSPLHVLELFLLPFAFEDATLTVLCRSQPHARTIEGTLWDALVKSGAVSQDNADSITKVLFLLFRTYCLSSVSHYVCLPPPEQVNFSRAARTDAGVHAAGNLVSMKLITQVPGVADLVARINEELPPEIRLWGYVGRASATVDSYIR